MGSRRDAQRSRDQDRWYHKRNDREEKEKHRVGPIEFSTSIRYLLRIYREELEKTTTQKLKADLVTSSIRLGVFLRRLFVTMYLDRPLVSFRRTIRLLQRYLLTDPAKLVHSFTPLTKTSSSSAIVSWPQTTTWSNSPTSSRSFISSSSVPASPPMTTAVCPCCLASSCEMVSPLTTRPLYPSGILSSLPFSFRPRKYASG